jgi:hypothetical protein
MYLTVRYFYKKLKKVVIDGDIKIILALTEIIARIQKLEDAVGSIGTAKSIEFYTTIDGTKRRIKNMFLKVSENLPVSIEIKDIHGNAAQVDGAPKWASTDETLATVTASEDGLSALVTPIGPVGVCKIQVSADADLGEGVKSILGELEIELLAGEAAVVSIVAGTPVAQ